MCRLRAEATCRAWRQALQGAPVRTLYLGYLSEHDDEARSSPSKLEGKHQWVALARPGARSVDVREATEQSILALHSLDCKVRVPWLVPALPTSAQPHQCTLCCFSKSMLKPDPTPTPTPPPHPRLPNVLQLVEDLAMDCSLPSKVLPHPHVFPNLQTLSVFHSTWEPAWFGQLGQLRRLQCLELHSAHAPAGQPPQPCVVSGPPTLTHLLLEVGYSNPPPQPALHIDLTTLPSLEYLSLNTNGSSCARRALARLAAPRPHPACSTLT